MQPILISRFITNLFHAEGGIRNPSLDISQGQPSALDFRMPTIALQDFIGPMGESLAYGDNAEWYDEDDQLASDDEDRSISSVRESDEALPRTSIRYNLEIV